MRSITSLALTAVAAAMMVPSAFAQNTDAASAAQQNSVHPRRPVVTVTAADQDFATRAAQAGMAEVAAGRIAESNARDPAIRDFARRMVRDHAEANDRLKRIARDEGIDLPAASSSEQAAQVEALHTVSSSDFDQTYLQDFGVPAHADAVDLFRNEAEHGGEARLRRFARQTLPVLRSHLAEARQLQNSEMARTGTNAVDPSELATAQRMLTDAVAVLDSMKADQAVATRLDAAKGLVVLPHYGRGGFVVGGQGGSGVLVVRENGGWSNPVFLRLTGASIGVQAGAAEGPLAMLLMTNGAVAKFDSAKKFSLNADAGLTIGDFSKRSEASTGKIEDVLVWSNAKGAYAGASIAATDVSLDRDANRAYYGRSGLDARHILSARTEDRHANPMSRVLPS